MTRKLLAGSAALSLCLLPVTPALGQDARFSGFDGPRGVTATVNLRVPLGPESRSRSSYGLTLGFGHDVGAAVDGRTRIRSINVADLRFDGSGFDSARIAGFDLANVGRDRRMNMIGGKDWIWLPILLAAGVLTCIEFCDDDGSEESDESDDPSTPTTPTG